MALDDRQEMGRPQLAGCTLAVAEGRERIREAAPDEGEQPAAMVEANAHRRLGRLLHDRPGAIRVPAGADVVWIEGTGTIREEFAPWIDASIWIQGDLDEQERRLVARDGSSAAQQQHIAEWLSEELPLMLRERPWQKATIVVDGTTGLEHDPDTEIVVASPAAL